MDYDVDEYFRHYILEHLRAVELAANTALVHLLKNGNRRVTKKDLKEKYGQGKGVVVQVTRDKPELLDQYRRDKREYYRPPLDHLDIARYEGSPMPNWDTLLNEVTSISSGRDHFSKYEKAIESFLTALFYPSLTNPYVQREIHDGRKRIDITYTNVATSGFFGWLGQHFAAAHLFIECKNYSSELGNPELDQLGGRFSPSRGQVGLLVCREFPDKDLFLQRCRDTAKDMRGFILPLDDSDLETLADERKRVLRGQEFSLLKERFDFLIM
jgi:hypothetical protein